jgi:hypothetical protein
MNFCTSYTFNLQKKKNRALLFLVRVVTVDATSGEEELRE